MQQKKAASEVKAVPGKSSFTFPFKEINAPKKQLKTPKVTNTKKRKAVSLLSREINLTHCSEKIEEHLFASSTNDSTSNKLKSTHPTSELVVGLTINHEHFLIQEPVTA
jgi:hypothetical protein